MKSKLKDGWVPKWQQNWQRNNRHKVYGRLVPKDQPEPRYGGLTNRMRAEINKRRRQQELEAKHAEHAKVEPQDA